MTARIQNHAASARARLLKGARERGEDFSLTLQRYAAERFLYRLGISPHREKFVLKGAMLFALWGGSRYRPTRDLDFTGYGEPDAESLLRAVREICALPFPEDGVEFQPGSAKVEPIREGDGYGGLRVRLLSGLDGARIVLQIDVGFGNAVVPPARDEEYPALLAGPRPNIRAYPRETVVAEKLHAVAVLGKANSRMKDFYDLFVLAGNFEFQSGTLAKSIAATFKRRETPVEGGLPVGLSPAFFADPAKAGQWRSYRERNALPSAPADFDAVGETLRAFLGPVWNALAGSGSFKGDWKPGGPWG